MTQRCSGVGGSKRIWGANRREAMGRAGSRVSFESRRVRWLGERLPDRQLTFLVYPAHQLPAVCVGRSNAREEARAEELAFVEGG